MAPLKRPTSLAPIYYTKTLAVPIFNLTLIRVKHIYKFNVERPYLYRLTATPPHGVGERAGELERAR